MIETAVKLRHFLIMTAFLNFNTGCIEVCKICIKELSVVFHLINYINLTLLVTHFCLIVTVLIDEFSGSTAVIK